MNVPRKNASVLSPQDPSERKKRLEKLNDPYSGEVPALPKFDGNLAMRHFKNVEVKKTPKISSNNVGFYMHNDYV
jgi:hypothetical protein